MLPPPRPHHNAKEQSHINSVFLLIRSSNERRNGIPSLPPIFLGVTIGYLVFGACWALV